MRQFFAWYSPEFDIIVLQYFIEDRYVAFEWSHKDMCEMALEFGTEIDPMQVTLWFPLGEI